MYKDIFMKFTNKIYLNVTKVLVEFGRIKHTLYIGICSNNKNEKVRKP